MGVRGLWGFGGRGGDGVEAIGVVEAVVRVGIFGVGKETFIYPNVIIDVSGT